MRAFRSFGLKWSNQNATTKTDSALNPQSTSQRAAIAELVITIICTALLAGCCSRHYSNLLSRRTTTIDLETGTVELPNGFIHYRGRGIDSLVGDFTRRDGKFRINYDVGEMAGVYTSQPVDHIVSSNNITVGKLQACIVVSKRRDTKWAVVSFPDTAANFFADIHENSELEALKKVVATYKLKRDGRTK